ncbi:Apoptosis regulator bax [Plakobranchus ocellatus]|uniref:Apoptosis regulator bax n=1 Tax=Plakobranchus ocellatus TaxID=259542 RepID=A0AAV4E1P6_9GAST|nr:Apoptosis regulator bax [Plakobranchus ocellatus]
MDANGSSKEPRLINRRPSGTPLVPLHIPALDTSEPVRPGTKSLYNQRCQQEKQELRDVEDEGVDLFQNFLKVQIEGDKEVALEEVLLSTLSGYKSDLWVKDGSALQRKANNFSLTKERKAIQKSCLQVDLNMSHDEFRDFVNRFYFQHRMSLKTILGLFFLCSDIILLALKSGSELFQQFLLWSLKFIKIAISSWVHQQGGWSAVLKMPVHPLLKVCLWMAVSVAALFALIRLNKWKTS